MGLEDASLVVRVLATRRGGGAVALLVAPLLLVCAALCAAAMQVRTHAAAVQVRMQQGQAAGPHRPEEAGRDRAGPGRAEPGER